MAPSPAFAFGATSAFLVCCLLQLPLSSGLSGFVIISALRLLLPLLVSFIALFHIGDLGLCSVIPGPGFCPCSATTVLVYLCFPFFLQCFLPYRFYICPFGSPWSAAMRFFFFLTLLTCSDFSSFAMGSPFGPSQLLRLVPSPPSPDLSESLSATIMFSVFSGRFSSSSSLVFCEFLLFHYHVVSLVCGFSSGCAPWFGVLLYGVLPPPCLSCSSLGGVLLKVKGH